MWKLTPAFNSGDGLRTTDVPRVVSVRQSQTRSPAPMDPSPSLPAPIDAEEEDALQERLEAEQAQPEAEEAPAPAPASHSEPDDPADAPVEAEEDMVAEEGEALSAEDLEKPDNHKAAPSEELGQEISQEGMDSFESERRAQRDAESASSPLNTRPALSPKATTSALGDEDADVSAVPNDVDVSEDDERAAQTPKVVAASELGGTEAGADQAGEDVVQEKETELGDPGSDESQTRHKRLSRETEDVESEYQSEQSDRSNTDAQHEKVVEEMIPVSEGEMRTHTAEDPDPKYRDVESVEGPSGAVEEQQEPEENTSNEDSGRFRHLDAGRKDEISEDQMIPVSEGETSTYPMEEAEPKYRDVDIMEGPSSAEQRRLEAEENAANEASGHSEIMDTGLKDERSEEQMVPVSEGETSTYPMEEAEPKNRDVDIMEGPSSAEQRRLEAEENRSKESHVQSDHLDANQNDETVEEGMVPVSEGETSTYPMEEAEPKNRDVDIMQTPSEEVRKQMDQESEEDESSVSPEQLVADSVSDTSEERMVPVSEGETSTYPMEEAAPKYRDMDIMEGPSSAEQRRLEAEENEAAKTAVPAQEPPSVEEIVAAMTTEDPTESTSLIDTGEIGTHSLEGTDVHPQQTDAIDFQDSNGVQQHAVADKKEDEYPLVETLPDDTSTQADVE
eukprot:CAMPEP_0114241048 /NCGR_PEP_ID=MMETSP0058-20121206/9429_1 /TAXON_ID=36894 /ORGANISM="Pyramimonas parkeae, CCMP726" /LENGTH=674 /DNA_ID=CAMNT_0001353557 /DNA_START=202 /DNA_END=2226 /DNA_ORIENTATION=+